MLATVDAALRFDRVAHEYSINGIVVPSVTQLLERAGYISDVFYARGAAERGQAVHQLCADFDLGVFTDPATVTSSHKGYLLAYAAALAVLQPTWEQIEVAHINQVYRFGGRPDRVGRYAGAQVIVELKSGAPEPYHQIQTALHDILLGDLPIMVRQRFGLYVKATGRFRLVPMADRRDYDKARDVLTMARQ